MAFGKEVVTRILILADGSQARREFDKTTKSGRQAEREFNASSKRLGHAANMASNVVLGAGVVIAGYSVKAAMSAEAGQTAIRNALAKTNLSITDQAKTYKDMQKAAEEASTHGGGAAPEEMAGLARLVRLTGSATAATQANAAANRLAVGAQIPYAQAVNAVAMAETGRMRGLQKYVPLVQPVKKAEQELADSHKLNLFQLDQQAKAMGKAGPAWKKQQMLTAGITKDQLAAAQVADKNATAQKMLTQVSQKYAGAQETSKQKLQDAKHAIENAAAAFGTALLPAVKWVTNALRDAAGWISHHQQLAKDLFVALMALAGAYKVLRGVLAVKKLFNDLNTVFAQMPAKAAAAGAASEAAGGEAAAGATLATTAWRVFMMTTIIGLVITGIVLMLTHWKQVKKIVSAVAKAIGKAMTAAFRWIVNAAKDAWGWIKKNWPYILGFLTGPIGLAVVFVLKHFNQVKHAVQDVWKFIKGIGQDILNAIEWPFKTAWEFIKKLPGRILHAFKSVLKNIPLIGGLFSQGGAVHKAAGGPIYRATGGGGPLGTDTVPAWLSPGEGVVNRAGMRAIGESGLNAINQGRGGGAQNITIEPAPVTIKLDSRVIAQGVLRYTLNRAARGSSSLVGGALATHGGYTEFATGAR